MVSLLTYLQEMMGKVSLKERDVGLLADSSILCSFTQVSREYSALSFRNVGAFQNVFEAARSDD